MTYPTNLFSESGRRDHGSQGVVSTPRKHEHGAEADVVPTPELTEGEA